MSLSSKIGLFGGILLSLLILLFTDLQPGNYKVTLMAAIAVLMASWWITEAVPLAVTSLIPLVLFPAFGLVSSEAVSGSYMNSTIFLFLGGFLLAIGMETWGLHKRIALRIIRFFGGSPNSIILGILFSTAFLSMWISNTATALMMLPIGLSILKRLEDDFGEEKTKNFSKSIMLSIAYASSIGGIGTLVGTPPNLAFVRILKIMFPESPVVSFSFWMLLCIPIMIFLLGASVLVLTKGFFRFDKDIVISKDFIKKEYDNLGVMRFEEKVVAAVFTITALLWIFRADLNLGFIKLPGWNGLFPYPDFISDGFVAVTMSLLLFFIPSGSGGNSFKRILDSNSFKKVPWDIILLFGGGFALAEGFTSTGLSQFIGERIQGLVQLPPFLLIFLSTAIVIFLTELTSNTAVANMLLPIMAAVSLAAHINPMLLMITATLASSLGFMLPVGTPPNTIVFASERLKVSDMAKAGFALNISAIIITSLIVYFLGSILFDFNTYPEWAK